MEPYVQYGQYLIYIVFINIYRIYETILIRRIIVVLNTYVELRIQHLMPCARTRLAIILIATDKNIFALPFSWCADLLQLKIVPEEDRIPLAAELLFDNR